jgi:thiol-disulfide isomerase/thioredoxin
MHSARSLQSARRALLQSGVRWLAASALVVPIGAGCYGMRAAGAYASAPADWNAGEIAWMEYASGLAAAKAERKPVVLVFYTDWCPHCHEYSRLFHDSEIVQLSQRFVMIRVERDGHRDISAVYDIDGEYIPRTFFLSPAGVVLTDLASDHDEFRYFLDERDPGELIDRMRRALERLGPALAKEPVPGESGD